MHASYTFAEAELEIILTIGFTTKDWQACIFTC